MFLRRSIVRRHPLLQDFLDCTQAILALLLDYDGTLSPIVKHPDLAFIPGTNVIKTFTIVMI